MCNDTVENLLFCVLELSLPSHNDGPMTRPPLQYSKESYLLRHDSAAKVARNITIDVVYSRL